jgi:hypothetical protein
MRQQHLLYFCITFALAATAAAADEVTDWNHAMLVATLTPPVTGAPVTTRVAAIFQSAVFDAVNGIERRYAPIHVPPAVSSFASERAAAVQAAYVTLVDLFPAQQSKFDQMRATSLAAITDPQPAIRQGIVWGQFVADQIWAWRSQDGFSATTPPYIGGTNPGEWRPTPPAMAPGLVPQLATTTPWVITSPSQFRTAGPPALNSDQYTADFNETKSMGSATGSGRTPDQTLFVNFWQSSNPPDYWDPVVISLAEQHRFTMAQTAGLLALVNLAIADAAIGCWDAKYAYSFWRPITAINLADTDGNDATLADPTWTPLIVTPPFPEYPSAHSCVSGAAARILSATFGEESSFTVVSGATPGATRSFHSFTAAIEEVETARIAAGIHFRTACVDGVALGVSVADYVMAHAMRPFRPGRD